jgi:two-component system, OmpR family, phosphate regulon sensor histidine kinase PhoR
MNVRDLLALLPDPHVVLDAHGIIRALSKSAADPLLGLEGLAEGLPFAVFVRTPEVRLAIESCVTHQRPVEVDWNIRQPVTRVRALQIVPCLWDGESAVLIHWRDRTQEVLMREQHTAFVANASHELRTPLAALIGCLDTLTGAARNDPAAQDMFLNLMRTQAERMRRLINDLLDLSRVERLQHQAPKEDVDLVKLVRETVAHYVPYARQNAVELESVLTDKTLVVRGDADDLARALEKLIDNAIKYGSSGKRIVVRAARDAQGCVIVVQDFGAGIPDYEIPRLHERFYRGQNSTDQQGFGLGLAIVHKILTRHGGLLKITSTLGEGSAFRMIFGKVRLGLSNHVTKAPHSDGEHQRQDKGKLR